SHLLSLVDTAWKYIFHVDSLAEELYNLEEDPVEHHNVFSTYPERAEYYRHLVQSWSLFEQDYYRTQAGKSFTDTELVIRPVTPQLVLSKSGSLDGMAFASKGNPLYGPQFTYSEG